jgi:hypothetical protein
MQRGVGSWAMRVTQGGPDRVQRACSAGHRKSLRATDRGRENAIGQMLPTLAPS